MSARPLNEKFASIRKGLLEFLILKIVASDKVYVADILQRLSTTEFATQEGTLYPLLSKMRREGTVDYEWHESDAGPPRKYYTLTAKGKAQLGELNEVLGLHQPGVRQPRTHLIMQKVITINLNGNAYQLDESGYDALRAYLNHADAQLGGNPDKAEIIRDLEQSIAEKCMRFLGPGKSVVSTLEVEQILRDVGPVDGGPAPSGEAAAQQSPRAENSAGGAAQPRRLYQIREGAMLSGTCNGLAAYFNLDPTIVRVAFVVGAIVEMTVTDDPPWMTVMIYVFLVFFVPYAKTLEQLAAAQGTSEGIPYKVQELVERVKAKFGGLHHKAR